MRLNKACASASKKFDLISRVTVLVKKYDLIQRVSISKKCDLISVVIASHNKQKTLTYLVAWKRFCQTKSVFMPRAENFPTSYGNRRFVTVLISASQS